MPNEVIELNKSDTIEKLNDVEKITHYYNLGNNANFSIPNGKGGHVIFTNGTCVTDDEHAKLVIETWVTQTNHSGATKEVYNPENLRHNPVNSAKHFGHQNDSLVITDVMGAPNMGKPMGGTVDVTNKLVDTPTLDLQAQANKATEAKAALAAAQKAIASNLSKVETKEG